MHYVIIMPELLTAACGQWGAYVEPLTAACDSERVNLSWCYFDVQSPFPKVYLKSSQTSTMELFC